jgi:hypothetical protein
MCGEYPYVYLKFVWRQLGFAFFGATTPVAALFIFERKTNMSELKFRLEGLKGELKVYEDRVEINKKGQGFITGNSSKTLPMANIMSVSVTPSTFFARGCIEFTVPGGKDSRNIEQALKNENALPLKAASQNEEAMKIKAYVEEQVMKCASNKGGTTIVQQAASPAEELKKMKELLDMGIITQEEFDTKKKQLLGL